MIELSEMGDAAFAGWDRAVARFPNRRVVHHRAWVSALEGSGYGRALYLTFAKAGQIVGCLPGLLLNVGPFRVFGSSLPGWQTVSMGPAFDPRRVSTSELVAALIPYLEREHGVAHVELLSPDLDPESMRALGFHGIPVPTYRAPLFPGQEDRAMRMLKDSARRNIRRGMKLGLSVAFEEDERFVDEHYEQLQETYLRGGNRINYSRQRVRECFRHLQAAGQLLAVTVRLPASSVCIASGMFTICGQELCLWTWAHRTRYRWYYPTELMTWAVMTRAMQAGCTTFDLMGRGEFKAKFGAELETVKVRWIRSRYKWLAKARDLAEKGSRLRMAVCGQLDRLGGRRRGDAAERPGGEPAVTVPERLPATPAAFNARG